MDNIYDSFVTADGKNIFFQSWSPSGESEMVIALVHDQISAGLFLSASRGGEKAIRMAGRITMPVLLMHGTADAITSPEGSKSFSENSGDNVTLRLWDGLYHELHNEPEKDEVFSFIAGWLGKNIG